MLISVYGKYPGHNINPGNPIYRPVLIDRMRERFKGATNEYLLNYINTRLNMPVTAIKGEPPRLLACPVCRNRTFSELGTWHTCPVCGWNSDPMQEAMPAEAIGSNGISLQQARENFAQSGAISQKALTQIHPDGRKMYPCTE